MKYQFKVRLTDRDFLDYNLFVMLESTYGKRSVRNSRILYSVIFFLLAVSRLLLGRGSASSIVAGGLFLLFGIFFLIMAKRLMALSVCASVNSMKKRGKMSYSPEAELAFFESGFVETTPVNRNEHFYVGLEKICVLEGKIIYLFISTHQAYLLPQAAFASQAEYDSFLAFLQTVCQKIEFYPRKK